MANRTVKYASSIHGTNPQYLIEKIVRTRIHESKYWKENCLLLNSALVLERAVDDLKYVGGVYGANIKPTPFLCLTLKLLQIQPQKDIIYLYLEQTDFKYLRVLGAFYLRLVGSAVEVYTKLEPLYKDYRKLRIMDRNHRFDVIHMDELIDKLLREERVFDVILPRLTKRIVLEENRDIEPYKSELEDQNLLPTQLIEEKIEEDRMEREGRRSHLDSPSLTHDKYHHNEYPLQRKSRPPQDEKRHHSHQRSHSSKNHRDNRQRDDRYHERSRSPQEHKPGSSRATGSKCRFSQQEIDAENAIRVQVGLKPLRI